MPGSFKPLNNPPPVNIDAMLLLTDGSVMGHEYRTQNWYKLIPDDKSDYSNGTWQPLSPMPNNAPLSQNGPTNAPLYFASAVLRDGTVFCAGGEYNNGSGEIYFLAAETYDPVADAWTALPTPTGWTNIGDASSCVFPDGRVLLGNDDNTPDNVTAIWDPESATWSPGGDSLDSNSEEGWSLLPDGTILAVQCSSIPNAQKYIIATNQWVSAGATPVTLPAGPPGDVPEMGPQILLPDGRVFAIGASGHTALYTPPNTVPTDPGSWAAGPDFPASGGQLMAAVDAPACLLPNGNVLCVVGPIDGSGFSDPTVFFEFNPASLALIPVPGPAIANTSPTYNARLLLLPTGQVLYSVTSDSGAYDLQIYTPSGGPQPSWRPSITHVPRHLHPGGTYRLHGRQLNGLSQACAYGDDQQMATNYPLVRLWGSHGVGAAYCRTFNHSTMGVATGAVIHHTHFEVPHHLPRGEYRLVVIANGIASTPVEVHVERRGRDHHDGDHDMFEEEIITYEHDDNKYKDKDAKEVKEKDVKEVKEKEKDFKEVEGKHCKEKDCKEIEHKVCKEKDCKEQKEKDCPEHFEHRRDEPKPRDELFDRIERLVERIERLEDEHRRRSFIRPEERPDVGAHALRRGEDDRRHDEERRLEEEERRRLEAERGASARRSPPETPRPEPPKPDPAAARRARTRRKS